LTDEAIQLFCRESAGVFIDINYKLVSQLEDLELSMVSRRDLY